MTDYEAASLALQEVIALAAVAGIVVGFAQCALIWAGLRMMRRAADRRDVVMDQQHQADERRHAEAMQTHAEAMKESERRHVEAMKESDRRHAETMKESDRRHAETMQALDGQRRALEVLIERTAPNPGAGE